MTRTSSNGQNETVSLANRDWLGLIAIAVAVIALPCGLVGWIYADITARIEKVDEKVEKVVERSDDHEIRLTKREANSFTSQDANKLLLAVNQLNIQMAQQQKEVDHLDSQREELLSEMRKFESQFAMLIKDVLKEVLKEVQELRKDMNTL